MGRPTCGRCGGPLDFLFDPETGRPEWLCNNPAPLRTDEEHRRAWDELSGDDAARLEREAADVDRALEGRPSA
jgi:hypothetical protein